MILDTFRFKLLKNLRFYSESAIREKLKVVENIMRRGMTRKIETGRRRRDDILISYLDHYGKSSAQLGHWYADETRVYTDNVVEKSKLTQLLAEQPNIQAIVFIDDFVGTGNSATGYLKDICEQIDLVKQHCPTKVKLVFAGVAAYAEGWSRIQREIESLDSTVELHACDILDKSDQCFSDSSKIFNDADEREEARNLSLNIGRKLSKEYPLGYGDLEMAIVFAHNCPNNSLPIFWKESTGQFDWKPLFKRG